MAGVNSAGMYAQMSYKMAWQSANGLSNSKEADSSRSTFDVASFMKSASSKRLGGSLPSSSAMGYDYAAANTAKLQKILDSRYQAELQRDQALSSYRANAKSFYDDFSPAMNSLKDAASKLKNTSFNSTLKPMGYGSSNGSAVTNVSGSIDSNANIAINVKQIATAQKNTYDSVSSSAKGAFDGLGSVSLNVGGKKSTFNFDISANMTNEDALKSIASKINDGKTGVTASVVTKDGKSSLELVSDKTGEAAGFTAEMGGALSSSIGSAKVSNAQNAIYQVNNGAEVSSASNKISLEGGKISATLSGAGEATLSKNKLDPTSVLNSVKDFAKSYNDVVDMLGKHSGKSNGIRNLSSSYSNTRFISSALSSIGIDTDSSGKLTVNEERFSAAFSKDREKVTNILGSSGGLAGEAYQKTTNAINSSGRLMNDSITRKYSGFYGSGVGLLMDKYR